MVVNGESSLTDSGNASKSLTSVGEVICYSQTICKTFCVFNCWLRGQHASGVTSRLKSNKPSGPLEAIVWTRV